MESSMPAQSEPRPRSAFYAKPPSPAALKSWLDERHISTHPALRIAGMSDGSGLTVHLDADSEPLGIGTSLCTIPKSTIFSHRTASFAALLPPPPEVYTSPAISTLYLTACLLHELRLGEGSAWYGWLQILPRDTIPLPTFWWDESLSGRDSTEALEWIRGTTAERKLKRKDQEGLSLADLRDFFAQVAPFLPSTPSNTSPPSFQDFAYAYSLVSTRGFVIDAYHIIALVPFCDLFNHSSSTAATSLLSDTAVCAECGTLDGCEHEPGRPSSTAQTQGKEENDVVEMRVERVVEPGQEILSCYEDNAENGKLLVEWGFVDDRPSPDGVSWNPRELLDRNTIRPFTELLSSQRLLAVSQSCSKRVAPPSDTRPGLLNIYADGRASINLVIALALPYVLEADTESIEEVEAGMIAVIEGLDGATRDGAGVEGEILSKVRSLVEDRLDGLHSSEVALTDVESELKVLEPAQYAQRMAMTLHMQERIALEAAKHRWTF